MIMQKTDIEKIEKINKKVEKLILKEFPDVKFFLGIIDLGDERGTYEIGAGATFGDASFAVLALLKRILSKIR